MQAKICIEHESRFEHFERSLVPTADEFFSTSRKTTGRSAIDETERVRSKTHEIGLRVIWREQRAKLGELGRPNRSYGAPRSFSTWASRLGP
jgi:hypothetical protein